MKMFNIAVSLIMVAWVVMVGLVLKNALTAGSFVIALTYTIGCIGIGAGFMLLIFTNFIVPPLEDLFTVFVKR